VTCLRKKQNAFKNFKDLKEEDWERFVTKCESPEFVVNSEYMRHLRAQNELNHHLGNTGYVRKQSKWEQEDQRLVKQGVENPYEKFSG
jgi:cell division protein FtsI/penicillin-binding protein 2